MKRSSLLKCIALGSVLAVVACNVPDGDGDGTSEPTSPIEDGTEFEKPNPNNTVAEPEDDEVLEVIDVADGIQRQVTANSKEPSAEFITPTGSYLAIWVHENGTSSVFEGVPDGRDGALRGVDVDSPLALFKELAPEGMEAPAALSLGRPFSVLEAEAAARIAELSPEELMMEEQPEAAPPAVQAFAASSCSRTKANWAYNRFRPGVFDNSEGVNEYTASNNQYREARRSKDYQAFFQTTGNVWTPTQGAGGIQASYFRASVVMCSGSARLTLFRCLSSQGTANNGCGQAGSTIGATIGPFVTSNGGNSTWKDWPGGDIGRARLDQMGGSDLAVFSAMTTQGAYGAINGCYN